MTKLFTSTALATLIATASFAGDGTSGMPTNNYIEPYHLYDASISGTNLGVKVRVDGKNTVYSLGDRGLTRSIALDGYGDKMESWAATALGVDVEARLEGYREDHN